MLRVAGFIAMWVGGFLVLEVASTSYRHYANHRALVKSLKTMYDFKRQNEKVVNP